MDDPFTIPAAPAPALPPAPPAPHFSGEGVATVPCPLCEYDLRGLTEPRCPECGYRFTWDELSDPARRFHRYLFEHHPERNVWSFLQTLTRGLFPESFWSTLYPMQPSRPRRLAAYWLGCALPLFAAVVALALLNLAGMLTAMRVGRWGELGLHGTAVLAGLNDLRAGAPVFTSLMCLAWPWLTVAALLVFQVSLSRARLRWIHVLRCALYSGDVAFWCALPVALLALFTWVNGTWSMPVPFGLASFLIAPALWLWTAYRLATAYRVYLRFDHPVATVLASQVMVGLVYLKAWFVVQGL